MAASRIQQSYDSVTYCRSTLLGHVRMHYYVQCAYVVSEGQPMRYLPCSPYIYRHGVMPDASLPVVRDSEHTAFVPQHHCGRSDCSR